MHSKRTDRGVVNQDAAPQSPAEAALFNVVGPDGPPATPEPAATGDGGKQNGGGAPPAPPEPAPNPFDPKRLRLRLDSGESLGLQKRLTFLPVRKPSKEWFIRTHPDRENSWLETCVIELKEDREMYLVDPPLWAELAGESTFGPRLLALGVTRQAVPFLWPIRLPGADGKLDSWNASATDAAILAQTEWVRVSSNMELGAYELAVASGIDAEPKWPAEPMDELLKVAFRGRFIDSMDHPVLKRLRGEV